MNYEIDISEGIDLALYLFGNFQSHVTDNKFIKLPDDAVIFDVGANIGSVSLRLARKYPFSNIYAFEPTDYAYSKLKKNIELNPDLETRIIPTQVFLTSTEGQDHGMSIFSSWPVDTVNGDRHPIHFGIEKSSTDKQITIDKFAKDNNISRIDFIKIDTEINSV